MRTILIVDDDEINLKMAEFILQSSGDGYYVVKAESGLKCLEYLAEHSVDLILLDIEMPVLSGMEVLEIIRNKKEMQHIPVIFLTAAAEIEIVMEAGRLGVEDYVKKPFMPQELLERVRKIVC